MTETWKPVPNRIAAKVRIANMIAKDAEIFGNVFLESLDAA